MGNDADRALLDTHALIWLIGRSLKPATLDLLDLTASSKGLYVSAVSGWELGLLAFPKRGPPRLRLQPTPSKWLDRVLSMPSIREAPLTAAIAFAAAQLPPPFHDDPADRLLVATARELDMPLVTRDEKILDYAAAGHVRVIPC